MRRRGLSKNAFNAAAVGVLIVGIGGCNALYQYGTKGDVTIKVTGKERIVTGSGDTTSSKYLVWGTHENGRVETFENTDAWLQGKFSSSDLQGKLNEGETYDAKVYGWRIPFLSQYRNIVTATPAPQ